MSDRPTDPPLMGRFTPERVPPDAPSPHAVTRLLQELREGDGGAVDRLIPLICSELHAIAERQMRSEGPGHTLQPTALVHEAFLRLVDQHAAWQNRAHFFGVAAQAMRRILVDHSRRKRAGKRGGGAADVTLDRVEVAGDEGPVDLAQLDEALTRLAELDARQARVVELRFFAGLSVDETAEALGTSAATVKRDWQFAKASYWSRPRPNSPARSRFAPTSTARPTFAR